LEKSVLEATNLVMQQKLENQQLEIASHRNRLDDYTQMLISRNKQLSELYGALDLAEKSVDVLDKSLLEELYNQVIYTNDDWEKFQLYFNQVFPGYIPALRKAYPTLTPAETRSVLLDKMGLSLKEQAQIQGVTTGAIKQTRYRLHRKFPALLTTS
jgi:DNA-binding CsgD family transcriptional regulator